MKKSRLFAIAVSLACCALVRADYLFTYFTKNGEDGLHLASSTGGYHWTTGWTENDIGYASTKAFINR